MQQNSLIENINKVCLVDDDSEILESLERFFSLSGFEIKTFSSAIDYLEQLEENGDCLICDIAMEEMDGLELQRRLNKLQHLQPTIFITGHGTINMAVEAMKLGAFDFIQKPFNPELLLEKVLLAIESYRDRMKILSKYKTLTNREIGVFKCVTRGLSNKQISDELFMAGSTVEAHRSKVMKKMAAKSLPDLVKMSVELKL
jgi:FixJ family two-component response regulator